MEVGGFLQDSQKGWQLTWEEIRDQIKFLSGLLNHLGYSTGEKKAKGKKKTQNLNSTQA